MNIRTVLAFCSIGILASCVPGSPIYIGAPVATVQGTVYSLEDRAPVPGAEVCINGADTSCARTNDSGFYKLYDRLEETVSLQFRIPGLRPARIDSVAVAPPEVYRFDCTISTRMTLSTEPARCGTLHQSDD